MRLLGWDGGDDARQRHIKTFVLFFLTKRERQEEGTPSTPPTGDEDGESEKKEKEGERSARIHGVHAIRCLSRAQGVSGAFDLFCMENQIKCTHGARHEKTTLALMPFPPPCRIWVSSAKSSPLTQNRKKKMTERMRAVTTLPP